MRGQAPYWRIRTSGGGCFRRRIEGAPPVITFLGMIIFATVISIGSLDGRSGLSLFGKYTASGFTGLGPRPVPGRRRDGGGPTRSPGL